MEDNFPQDIYEIFRTGCELQEILYAGEDCRTMPRILRYNLQSYWHATLIKKVIGRKPKKVTHRKLYGKYYHAMIGHAHKQLRIISGKSCHTEQEERQFSYLKSIAKLTTNHHPSNVDFNLWIRYQVIFNREFTSFCGVG